MKRKTLISIVCVFIFVIPGPPSFAQTEPLTNISQIIYKTHSTILNEERTIFLRVPSNYSKNEERYPVLYMLDWQAPQNVTMVALIDQLVWGGVIPDLIVVGIKNTNRDRDLTPTKTTRPNTGGANRFLDFIGGELIPYIDKNYRTHPYRIFCGHSLGGLLVSYAFISTHHLFNAYIAASPALHWDHKVLLDRAEKSFTQIRNWNKTFFAALGDEPEYLEAFDSFKLLMDRPRDGFVQEFRYLPSDNHSSTVLPTYYAGFRTIFDGWYPPRVTSLSEIEEHYAKLSKRFGYEINIPENSLNILGYQLLNAKQLTQAIQVFQKNILLHPNSANAYDSLGEAYETNGSLEDARLNYEKAYKLAEKQGNSSLANIARKNVQRVSRATK